MATLPFFIVHLQVVTKSPGSYRTKEIGYPHFPKTIGEQIRKRRLDLKLLQRDVARTIGCTALTLVNWEKGHTQPSVHHMAGVTQFLGFNPFPSGTNLAQKLVNHRKALGVTQKVFAGQIGINPTTLARWERGQRVPSKNHHSSLRRVGFR